MLAYRPRPAFAGDGRDTRRVGKRARAIRATPFTLPCLLSGDTPGNISFLAVFRFCGLPSAGVFPLRHRAWSLRRRMTLHMMGGDHPYRNGRGAENAHMTRPVRFPLALRVEFGRAAAPVAQPPPAKSSREGRAVPVAAPKPRTATTCGKSRKSPRLEREPEHRCGDWCRKQSNPRNPAHHSLLASR